jgi:hypothetical protein
MAESDARVSEEMIGRALAGDPERYQRDPLLWRGRAYKVLEAARTVDPAAQEVGRLREMVDFERGEAARYAYALKKIAQARVDSCAVHDYGFMEIMESELTCDTR